MFPMNPILLITYPLNGLLMIGIPIALAIYLTRRFKYSWRLVATGAATFVISQIGHIPFNNLLSNLFEGGILPTPPQPLQLVFFSILWGLSAGLWEEFARYGAYRWFAKEARSWGRGLLLGTGHGGMEALLLGLIFIANFVVMASIRGQDVRNLISVEQATPEVLALAQVQIEAYWSQPWTMSLLGVVERFFALPIHLACSLLVMQVFTRRQVRWLGLSIALHTAGNATALTLLGGPWKNQPWGAYAVEGVIGLFALFSLGIIKMLYQPEPQPAELPPLAPIQPIAIPVIEIQAEDIEKTRYT